MQAKRHDTPIVLVIAGLAAGLFAPRACAADLPGKIKAFCIDFNWGPGGPNAFAAPGHWGNASPEEHVQWYKDLGANTIQTFCVSCNGYAWYKDGIVPAQPGLSSDFLKEVTRIGHKESLQVMGYFCIGANTRWGQAHPELSYGIPNTPHIPLTSAYLDYLDGAIRDVLRKTEIDGFMIDWVWNPDRQANGGKWLACEQARYKELMQEPFPGEDKLSQQAEVEYGRRAITRCWETIRTAAKETKPDCIIWLSCHNLSHPHVENSKMFREVDWLMNENPDPTSLSQAKEATGSHTRLVQCLCGWGSQHDAAKVMENPLYKEVGFYGFAKPDDTSFPPLEKASDGSLTGNAKNIDIMRKAFRDEGAEGGE